MSQRMRMKTTNDKLPSNKRYSQEETQEPVSKNLKKVVTGEVITKKKSPIRRLVGRFLADDVDDIKGYILEDVIIPAAKDTIYDIITGGTSMSLYGNTGGRARGSGKKPTNYSNISTGKAATAVKNFVQPRGSYAFDDIICQTRAEAEELISGLADCIDEYESASVADLYDMAGKTGNFTDNKWGWFSIQGARVKRVREGYMLDLPKVELLD